MLKFWKKILMLHGPYDFTEMKKFYYLTRNLRLSFSRSTAHLGTSKLYWQRGVVGWFKIQTVVN